jgi:hypothetical protein
MIEKPVNLRQDTWQFLLDAFNSEAPHALAEHPARYLYRAGIIEHPDLLKNSVIQLQSGVEYLITPRAANRLKGGDALIVLDRLDGHVAAISAQTIFTALSNDCEFDQLERGAWVPPDTPR